MDNYDFFRDLPIFRNMTDNEIAEALRITNAAEKHYDAGQIIFAEGDVPEYAGIVLEGCIQVIRDDYNGNRDIIGQAQAPGLFGEALCFCGVKEIPVSVIAKTESRVLKIRLKAVELPRKMQINLISEMSAKVLSLTNKIKIIQQKTTAEKLMCYFRSESKRNRSDGFDIPFSRQELADYLGVERSAMITELRKLKEKKKIEIHGKCVKILSSRNDIPD